MLGGLDEPQDVVILIEVRIRSAILERQELLRGNLSARVQRAHVFSETPYHAQADGTLPGLNVVGPKRNITWKAMRVTLIIGLPLPKSSTRFNVDYLSEISFNPAFEILIN